jgi:hypothetical protein
MKNRVTIVLLAVIAGVSFQGHRSLAMFASGDDAPVERLVANVTAYLAKKPKDASALYLLGRIYALAYSEKTENLRAFGFKSQKEGDLPNLDRHMWVDDKLPKPALAELKKYLSNAVTNYRLALRVAPNVALYHLSLASVIEKAGDEIIDAAVEPELEVLHMTAQEVKENFEKSVADNYLSVYVLKDYGASAVPLLRKLMALTDKEKEHVASTARKELINLWREEMIQHYWLAYMLAIRTDIPEREEHTLDTPVSEEAAEHYLKLISTRKLSDVEKLRVPQIEADLKTLNKRGRAMTPIIFSETENLPLQDLLTPRRVHFDMDGDGLIDECSWVKPETSILVWDPKRTGVVTSGRQLFGSVTWWIFWSEGYQALAALDDNGDGELSGAELRGLAVWRDRNGDGISDPGEVVPIEETEIAGLSVFSTETVSPNASPANRGGLRMKDGRRLGTYDWVLEVTKP